MPPVLHHSGCLCRPRLHGSPSGSHTSNMLANSQQHALSPGPQTPATTAPPISTAAVIALVWVQFPQLTHCEMQLKLELGPSKQLSPAHCCQACFHALVAYTHLHGPTARLLLRWPPMLLGLAGRPMLLLHTAGLPARCCQGENSTGTQLVPAVVVDHKPRMRDQATKLYRDWVRVLETAARHCTACACCWELPLCRGERGLPNPDGSIHNRASPADEHSPIGIY